MWTTRSLSKVLSGCAVTALASFARADAGGLAEEDDRADELVGALLGRLREQPELLPVIRL